MIVQEPRAEEASGGRCAAFGVAGTGNYGTTPPTDLRRHGRNGLLDPAKVTRSALQNAASIAGLMLTTDCMVSELAETSQPAAWRMGGMGRHGR